MPDAGLAPADPDDATVDRVLGWSTVASDRHRLRDRLRELRDRAVGRRRPATASRCGMAAARAALARLRRGDAGVGAGCPPDLDRRRGRRLGRRARRPAVALALADVLRRPGASALALDHARLLGAARARSRTPSERRAVIADLVDDLLAPLGSVVMPAGLRTGRSAGSSSSTARRRRRRELELVPGGLALVDLPPGGAATAEFRFRDTVRLGARGRHFAVDVAGGLGGLLVDLRDVPLRLPERPTAGASCSTAWQAAAVGGPDG